MDGSKKVASRSVCLLGTEMGSTARPGNSKCKASGIGKSGLVLVRQEACVAGVIKSFRWHK